MNYMSWRFRHPKIVSLLSKFPLNLILNSNPFSNPHPLTYKIIQVDLLTIEQKCHNKSIRLTI